MSLSEKKTESLITRVPANPWKPTSESMETNQETPPPPRSPPMIIQAAGQKGAQIEEFRYLGGLVTDDGDFEGEINCRSRAAWFGVQKFAHELFQRPNVPWKLEVRLLKA